ncbi:MAG: GNAT family N-acetyltransferase [Pseudomonadota bacterium]
MTFAAHPLTPDRWDDLATVFGASPSHPDGRGECGRCWCMWWRLPRGGFTDGRANRPLFRARVEAGPPPGLLGYEGATPVGWLQVGPRADVPEWNRPGRLTAPPDPADATDPAALETTWGVTCFVTRTGHRRKGVASRLLDAAIAHARGSGARALDACPVELPRDPSVGPLPDARRKPAAALYHGVASVFAARGFVEVARRRPDRPLVRLTLA